jgi:CheY-like chemotaxis protein
LRRREAAVRTLLIARDNALAKLRLTTIFCGAGYNVVAASTGRDALAAMLLHPPDLALIALRLPALDGVGLIHAMRADPILRSVPALALAMLPLPRNREYALAAGFNGYMLEASPKAKLLARVQRLLEIHDSTIESRSGD